jgi:hypothetical protein
MATSARGERRGVRSAWAAWLVLLLPWTPIETLAQTTGGGELTEAVDAFKRRDVQRAHALAEVAFETTGEADAHELLALTSLRLGQVARASLLYSELSARDDVPTAMKRRAASQVDALRRQGTVVTIALDPPGAELRVDGYRVGVAPLRAEIVLLPGPHDLEATLTNFRPRAERLTAHPRGHLHFQTGWVLGQLRLARSGRGPGPRHPGLPELHHRLSARQVAMNPCPSAPLALVAARRWAHGEHTERDSTERPKRRAQVARSRAGFIGVATRAYEFGV